LEASILEQQTGDRVCARKTGRVDVATSRIGAIQYCGPFNTFKPFNRFASFKG
jgi:hypothetical protein